MRTEAQAQRALELYGDTVRRICFLNLKSKEDTEDIFQNVFLKFLMFQGEFQSENHEKAWFIRVTINACKDLLKSFHRRNKVPLEAVEEFAAEQESRELLEVVLALPEKYKVPLYLFFYENYTAVEIAAMTGKKVNTVYSCLSRGKALLKEKLGGGFFAE